MAPTPPSNPLKGPGGHEFVTPQDFPSGRGQKNNNNNNNIKKQKAKAKKPSRLRTDQDPEVSEVETDTTSNIQTDLDTDADADADADAVVAAAATGPDVDEMPKRPPPPPKRDVDISMILSWQQRVQFDALNQAILVNIEAQAMKPFNYLDHPVAKQHRVKIWNFGPALAAAQNTQPPPASGPPPVVDATRPCEQGDANAKVDCGEHNSTAPRIIRIDASSVQPAIPSMNLLKEEATQYFNKWKATFLKRCNDLIVPKQSISDAGTSRQGQGALRGGGTGTSRGGRPQQEGKSSPHRWNKTVAHPANMALARAVVHQARLSRVPRPSSPYRETVPELTCRSE